MKSIFLPVFLLLAISAFGQTPLERAPDGGGAYVWEEKQPCLTPAERASIEVMLTASIEQLKKEGRLPEVNDRSVVAFDWPLRAVTALGYNSYYGISNYLDQDETGGIQDYNCGSRSYDGHNGTDIFTWPFPWDMVTNNSVEVIAGEAGTIVSKQDGNVDNHCACSGTWNAVYVQHSDGSIAWYGHMKNGSLTSKTVGQTVAKGEYLGVVASSGCSTGPHLHFEVYKALPYQRSNLIDPYYVGNCNGQNSQTWWASQKPYREPTTNAALTHDATPVHGCPTANEMPHFANTFAVSTLCYFAAYYHDQMAGHVTTYTIRKPDNSVWSTWNHTSPATYDASWWYWSLFLPSNGPNGTWKWQVTYQSTTVSHDFTVTGAAPVELTWFDAQKTLSDEVLLTWATATERDNDYFAVERSTDGAAFRQIGRVEGNGTVQETRRFSFLDKTPAPGMNYYRLRQVDFDGQTEYSDVASVQFSTARFTIAPNPVTDRIYLSGPVETVTEIRVWDAMGSLVQLLGSPISAAPIDVSGYPAGVYFLEIRYDAQVERVKILKK